MKNNFVKRYPLILLVVSILLAPGLFIACGGGGGGGGGNGGGDVTPGPPATLLSTTTSETTEVTTDGQWVLWTGKEKEQVQLFNGSAMATISSSLPSVWIPQKAAFDGRYTVFTVTDGEDYRIYSYDSEEISPAPVMLAEMGIRPESLAVVNGLAVWDLLEQANDYEIYYCDLTATTVPVKLTNNDTFDQFPVTDGTYIAWQAKRSDGSDYEIFYYDFATPVTNGTRVTDNTFNDGLLKIDAGVLAWEADAAMAVTDSEIFTYVIGVSSTPARVTSNNWHDRAPQTADGIVLWTSYVPGASFGDLHYADAINAPSVPVRVTSNSSESEGGESTRGGVITWVGGSVDTEIYYYDVNLGASTAQAVQLTDDSEYDDSPVTDGTIIAWRKGQNTAGEIYYHDMNSGSPTSMVPITNDGLSDFGTAVSGGVIGWVTTDGAAPTQYSVSAFDTAAPGITLMGGGSYRHVSSGGLRLMDTASGTRAAWISEGYFQGLWAKEVGDPGDPVLVSPPGQIASSIGIEGGIAVWMGPGTFNTEIYYADLNSPGQTVVQLTDNIAIEVTPVTDGSVIAWRDFSDTSIYYHDLASPSPTVRTLADTGKNYGPDVSGGVVTWYSSPTGFEDEEIYYSVLPGAAVSIDHDVTDDNSPATDGTYIAWECQDTSFPFNDEICYQQIGGSVVTLTDSEGNDDNPFVQNGVITWLDATLGFAAIRRQPIGGTQSDTGEGVIGSIGLFDVDGSQVVAQAGSLSDTEVYFYDFSSPGWIQLTDNGEDEYSLAVSGGVAVWNFNNTHAYMATP